MSELGKSSYHIFLVQMVYFEFFESMLFANQAAVVATIGNILICTTAGYGFYLLEKNLHEKSTGTFHPIRIYYRKIRAFVYD